MYLVFLISPAPENNRSEKKNKLVVEGNVEVRLPRGHRWLVI